MNPYRDHYSTMMKRLYSGDDLPSSPTPHDRLIPTEMDLGIMRVVRMMYVERAQTPSTWEAIENVYWLRHREGIYPEGDRKRVRNAFVMLCHLGFIQEIKSGGWNQTCCYKLSPKGESCVLSHDKAVLALEHMGD